jgi:hypothetical protein
VPDQDRGRWPLWILATRCALMWSALRGDDQQRSEHGERVQEQLDSG